MTITLTAIYENGVLYLSHPLDLPEHTKVRIEIESLPEKPEQSEGNVLQELLTLATDLGVDDLSEQVENQLYELE